MRFPIKSFLVTLASLLVSGGAATSGDIASGPASLAASVEAIDGASLLSVSGPAAASYSVYYFDGSGHGQEVASGSFDSSGLAEAVTPEFGVGVNGMSYAAIVVRDRGGEVFATQVQVLDPLFLWQ